MAFTLKQLQQDIDEAFTQLRTNIRDYPKTAAFDFLYFLLRFAGIGFGIYASIWLLPVLTSALAFTLLPQGVIALIALLPLLYCIADLAQTIEILYVFRTKIPMEQHMDMFLMILLSATLLLDSSEIHENEIQPIYAWNPEGQAILKEASPAKKVLYRLLSANIAIATPAAIGLGIYLSVQLIPFIVSALAAFGLPSAMSLLVGIIAAVALIELTRQVLLLPVTATNLYCGLKVNLAASKEHQYYLGIIRDVTGLVVVAGAGYVASLVFPLLLTSLLPLISSGFATFTALAVCLGIVLVAMNLTNYATRLINAGTIALGRKPAKLSIIADDLWADRDSQEERRPSVELYRSRSSSTQQDDWIPLNRRGQERTFTADGDSSATPDAVTP